MFSRAASLRRLAATGTSLLRPSPLSTTAKRAPKKAAVPVPEAVAATAPQQVARERPLPPDLDSAKVKRPTEIPFQPQVANTVHLIGTVGVLPVLEVISPGEYLAVSVIFEKKVSVENDSSQLWIPVIFQGDLAQIAACHLKENDLVYIVGQLSGDESTANDAHYEILILARSLSFVESNSRKDGNLVFEQDKSSVESNSGKDDNLVFEQDKKMVSDHSAEEKSPTRPLWNDMLSNPHNWWDNRATMTNPTSAAFEHKDKGQLLWLNEFTPEDVLSKLDTLAFYNTPKKSEISDNVKDASRWPDVFANPGDWKDNRIYKQNGKVKSRYPDFAHKSSGQALWLESAPGWVQLKFDELKTFGSSDLTHDSTIKNIYDVNDGKKTLLPNKKKDEDLWKDVIENPTKWRDNRLNKLKPRAPDFKHKDSGDALWLNTSPSWVQEKLPPAERTTNSEDLWKDVIENPTKWRDNRLNKRNPKAPDFKHKDSGDALWLSSSSPWWVLEKLAPAEKKLPPAESTTNSDDLWKDVIENPTKWWDNRLYKNVQEAIPEECHVEPEESFTQNNEIGAGESTSTRQRKTNRGDSFAGAIRELAEASQEKYKMQDTYQSSAYSISICMEELKKYVDVVPPLKRLKASKELQDRKWRETFMCMDEETRMVWFDSLE